MDFLVAMIKLFEDDPELTTILYRVHSDYECYGIKINRVSFIFAYTQEQAKNLHMVNYRDGEEIRNIEHCEEDGIISLLMLRTSFESMAFRHTTCEWRKLCGENYVGRLFFEDYKS